MTASARTASKRKAIASDRPHPRAFPKNPAPVTRGPRGPLPRIYPSKHNIFAGSIVATFLVVCLFSGGGGTEHALRPFGLDPSSVVSLCFETDTRCRHTLAQIDSPHLFVSSVADSDGFIGSVLALTENGCELVRTILETYTSVTDILVTAGSPCQGFSEANPNAKGIGDRRSYLVWVVPVIVKAFFRHSKTLRRRTRIGYLLENVPPKPAFEGIFNRIFKCSSTAICNGIFTAVERRRLFWANFDFPIPQPSEVNVYEYLDKDWRPLWELFHEPKPSTRFRCLLRSFPPNLPVEFRRQWRRYPLSMYSLFHLVYLATASEEDLEDVKFRVRQGIILSADSELRRVGPSNEAILRRGALATWIHREGGHRLLRHLHVHEMEKMMGFPVGTSRLPDDGPSADIDPTCWGPRDVIGNAFAIPTIKYIFSHIIPHIMSGEVIPNLRSVENLPGTYEEVMALAYPSWLGNFPQGNPSH